MAVRTDGIGRPEESGAAATSPARCGDCRNARSALRRRTRGSGPRGSSSADEGAMRGRSLERYCTRSCGDSGAGTEGPAAAKRHTFLSGRTVGRLIPRHLFFQFGSRSDGLSSRANSNWSRRRTGAQGAAAHSWSRNHANAEGTRCYTASVACQLPS